MTEKIDAMAAAATEISHGFVGYVMLEIVRAEGMAISDRQISEARAKSQAAMAKLLRGYILGAFEYLDEDEQARPLVEGALARHSLSLEEFGFSFGPVIRKLLRRGRIVSDWEYYVARGWVDGHDGDDAIRILGMIDAYDTPD